MYNGNVLPLLCHTVNVGRSTLPGSTVDFPLISKMTPFSAVFTSGSIFCHHDCSTSLLFLGFMDGLSAKLPNSKRSMSYVCIISVWTLCFTATCTPKQRLGC